MHADRARDKNYLMRNVIYILIITARKYHTGDVNGGRGESVSMALLLFKRYVIEWLTGGQEGKRRGYTDSRRGVAYGQLL